MTGAEEQTVSQPPDDDGFPWYVKAMLAVVVLVVVGVVVLDLLVVVGSF